MPIDCQPGSQLKIRLPSDLKDWLKQRAAANRRTLTREIEYRVLESQAREIKDSKQ